MHTRVLKTAWSHLQYLHSFSHSLCSYVTQHPNSLLGYPHTNDHLEHVAHKLSSALAPSHIQRRRTCVHMCTHSHTSTNIAIHEYVPRDSLHLCQHSILPALTSSVSHTLRSMQTSFESIYPSVLSLSLSLCLNSVALLLSSRPSLFFPSPVVVTYLVKIPPSVTRLQTVHIVLSLTFSALRRFKETRGRKNKNGG